LFTVTTHNFTLITYQPEPTGKDFTKSIRHKKTVDNILLLKNSCEVNLSVVTLLQQYKAQEKHSKMQSKSDV